MSESTLPAELVRSLPLNDAQREYLVGYFAGVAARGLRFADVEPAPPPASQDLPEDLVFEERVKRELHPLDAYPQLLQYASANKPPDKEDTFRFKWHGLFYLTPAKEAFMARLRIPGGVLRSFQLRELAGVAKDLTTGYVQITTRANLQLRLIQPKDAPEVLRRIQGVGLHTRGAGADNVRNLTASPTAGFDPHELIDVLPFCQELAQIILHDRAFYNLPRKFNVAFNGGGQVSTVEETNDLGARAVRAGGEIRFRIAAGGATGHQAFARDLGVLVSPAELNRVLVALIRVYIRHGNRHDRKKARLKHLLDSWPLEKYLAEAEKLLGSSLPRASLEPAEAQSARPGGGSRHLGAHPQKQPGLFYIGVAVPVGEITPKQMRRVAEITELYGAGEIRLTAWQNFLIPHIPEAYVAVAQKALKKCGLDTEASHVRAGLVACTGNSYCRFAQASTKGTALALAAHLEKKLHLDQPINIHLTGCPNSCAQHYIGDIGLLATKVRGGDGFHVFVGGGFGAQQAVGRQVFTGISLEELPVTLERMLRGYLHRRQSGETFQQFAQRHDLNSLQVVFTNGQ